MKLFISYSRDDKAWVYEFERHLREIGNHDVWIDRRLVPASDWWESILEHIEAAECVIVVLSPKAAESIYCGAELDYALALNKPVLPVMLKSCDLPSNLKNRRVQYQLLSDDMNLDRVLFKIEQGLSELRLKMFQGAYPLQQVQRPPVPEPETSNPEHIYETFALAEEAHAEHNMSLCEQLFARVIAADPEGLGRAASERLNEIRFERHREMAYSNVKRLAENPATLKGARAAWNAFERNYPDYDPLHMADRLVDHPPAAPVTAPPTSSQAAPARAAGADQASSAASTKPEGPASVVDNKQTQSEKKPSPSRSPDVTWPDLKIKVSLSPSQTAPGTVLQIQRTRDERCPKCMGRKKSLLFVGGSCEQCDGKGSAQFTGPKLIRLETRVSSGTVLKVNGEGHYNPDTKNWGDLYLEIEVKPDTSR